MTIKIKTEYEYLRKYIVSNWLTKLNKFKISTTGKIKYCE